MAGRGNQREESAPAQNRTRVAIVGAGAVGSTIAYAAMMRGLAHEIVLVDSNEAKADAEAKDLLHGSMFVPSVDISTGPLSSIRGSAVVVVTAGAKQKPGQSRLQLAATNVDLFRTLIPQIRSEADSALLLIVSNPVDVLTHAALRFSGLPPERVIGSGTVLDSSRFRALLARHLRVSVANVHAYIVGEHGDSEVPLWSSAQIANIPLDSFRRTPDSPLLAERDRAEIFHQVRTAAAQVIAAKGATNWAIGVAVARILEAILRDEQAVLTVSRLLTDYHGLRDVCLSVPCLVGGRGAGEPLPVAFSESELAALRRSAEVLEGVQKSLEFHTRPAHG